MQSHTIVLAVAVLAIPLAVTGLPDQAAKASASVAASLPQATTWQLAQAKDGFSDTIHGKQLEAAPVPTSLGPGIAPADRAASPDTVSNGAGPLNAIPFSGAPDSERGTGDPTSSRDQGSGANAVLPDLGK